MDYDTPKMSFIQEKSFKNKWEIIKYRGFVRSVTLVAN